MRKKDRVNFKLLRYIYEYTLENRYAPVLREMQEAMGWASRSTAHFAVNRLEKKGYVTRLHRSGRTIKLTEKGIKHLNR